MAKCLKRIEQNNKSGKKANKTPHCKCFEQLLFLKDVISSSPDAVSNTSLANRVLSSESSIEK